MRHSLLTLFFTFCCFAFAQAQSNLNLNPPGDETAYFDGEFLIMLEDGATLEDILEKYATDFRSGKRILKKTQELSPLSKIHLAIFDHNAVDSQKMLAQLQQEKGVRAVQMNHVVEDRALPNDPQLGSQWHHVESSDNDIDSDLAWDITTGGATANGDRIVVCVIEGGGSNYNHPDLIDNHWTNGAEIDGNGVDDDGNGYVDDVNGWNPTSGNDNVGFGGHGTAVSGMIGATGDNNVGVVGVNWDVEIMQVGLGSLTEANVIASYNYPYTMRDLYNTSGGNQGALVVATNASWGIDNANPANYPLWCAYYDDLGEIGILNCGSTANNNVNIDVVGDMPTGCSSDYMIAVTATNSADVRTFSGFGATTIDIGAPGEAVFLPSGTNGYSPTSGTSFAGPCVAGGIALVYSAPCSDLASLALANPQAAADQVRGYIFDGVDVVPNLVGECVTGGRLNVRNSLDLALQNCGPLPPCEPESISLSDGSCFYEVTNGEIENQVVVEVSLSEAFCSVETVCYSSDLGGLVCLEVAEQGLNINNANNTLVVTGLDSNTTYDFYYTTADGTSTTVSITTDDCSNEIIGCIDQTANNFNPLATLDDGSCTYDCDETTFTLDTDCWGAEVIWTLTNDANGAEVFSVEQGTYGNQQTFVWSDCLEVGCYTMVIQDSFGDGLAGIASGCEVDGNYVMTASDGSIIFQMDDPNYGSSVTHNFCVTALDQGCTDPEACNFNSAATADNGSCLYPGCTDQTACNYDAEAGCDDGSCEVSGCTNSDACNYDATASCDNGSCIIPPSNDLCANALPLNEGDNTINNANACQNEGYVIPPNGCNVTDGWCNQNGIEASVWYSFTTPSQATEITLITAYGGPGTLSDSQMAVFEGCDGILVGANDDGGEDQFMSRLDFACGDLLPNTTYLVLIDGYNGDEGIATLTLEIGSGNCTVLGCTDSAACNFDGAANTDDGSCEFLSCLGCIDEDACNFNSDASQDDGSCEFESCAGCTDDLACNFDSSATLDNGTCDYISCVGCTDPDACNYDENTTIDDESCFYDCGCIGDFDNNGAVDTADALIILGAIGCGDSCGAVDMNNDQVVNTVDLVTFLSVFGSICVN